MMVGRAVKRRNNRLPFFAGWMARPEEYTIESMNKLIIPAPNTRPAPNFHKVENSNCKPIDENVFLPDCRNRYVISRVKIGPIVLVRKLFDKPGIAAVINSESLSSPVLMAQKRTALPIITDVELWFTFSMICCSVAEPVL